MAWFVSGKSFMTKERSGLRLYHNIQLRVHRLVYFRRNLSTIRSTRYFCLEKHDVTVLLILPSIKWLFNYLHFSLIALCFSLIFYHWGFFGAFFTISKFLSCFNLRIFIQDDIFSTQTNMSLPQFVLPDANLHISPSICALSTDIIMCL